MSRADAELNEPSRYVVGIDLGTTNSAVAYVDTAADAWRVETFLTPQIVAPGVTEARETLPSFHYEPASGEFSPQALRLPWSDQPSASYLVGVLARDHGELTPGRLINSAKSWLCHAGVDRTAELLPWHAAADVRRLSPVEASSRYLAHFRAAWNDRFRNDPLEQQDVILTLPASFDEVARELTVKAARLAGLNRVVLVEEPQAAFYAWIDTHRDNWQTLVEAGQKILVCDIGGGTTDFTLIRVRDAGDGRVQFHRVAVGEHLILGGDNLDLAIAHHLEHKFAPDGQLEPRVWAQLARRARVVKETLLGPAAPERLTVNLALTGSRLIGGSKQVEATRDEIQQLLLEGFLPRVRLNERPQTRGSGFQEFGLPYAPDAAMTRYLGAFLSTHRYAGSESAETPGGQPPEPDPARPDIVLFNGGFFESPVLRDRLLEVLGSWFADQGRPWQPRVLANARLDLAVARGAAYYGMVRRGLGVRIAAGLARSYYVGVAVDDRADQAVCLAPAGLEEGHSVELTDRRFELLIRAPVEFPLFVSSTRLTDPPGALVSADREYLTPLPPIRTVLQTARKGESQSVAVHLQARLTEIGTLELSCHEFDGPRRWQLEFDVRAATQTDREAHQGLAEQQGFLDSALVETTAQLVRQTFSRKPADGGPRPESLVKQLELLTEQSRREWPSSLLRAWWQTLMDHESGRRLSDQHEARWFWLAGFALRPGYGMALDDWRVAQTWRLLQGKRYFHTPAVRVEWLILWRRIAGGLLAGQQRTLADPLLAELRPIWHGASAGRKSATRKPNFGVGSHESAEVWRLLGSLELLPGDVKQPLGEVMLTLAAREPAAAVRDALVWAIGRIGARQPMYGPLNSVLPAEVAERWLAGVAELDASSAMRGLAIMQLARRTDDRYRDVSASCRQRALAWFDRHGLPEHFQQLVSTGGQLASDEQGLLFGESLPQGLRLAGV